MTYSTVAIGTAFERHAVRFLNADLRMAVRRVGGRGDGGLDVRGYWWLPRGKVFQAKRPTVRLHRQQHPELSGGDGGERLHIDVHVTEPQVAKTARFHPPPGLLRSGLPSTRAIAPLRVFAQCKAEKRRVGPGYVREFEGTLAALDRMPSAADTGTSNRGETGPAAGSSRTKVPPLIGVMLSKGGFTSAATTHASNSAVPLLLVHLPGGHPDDIVDGGDDGVGSMDGDAASMSASPSGSISRSDTPSDAEPEPERKLEPESEYDSGSESETGPAHSTAGPKPGRKTKAKRANPEDGAGQDYGPPPRTDVLGLWWNKAFANALPGHVELRAELSPTHGHAPASLEDAQAPRVARVGVWYFGGRMGRYGPPPPPE